MHVKVKKLIQFNGHAMGVYALEQGHNPETVFSGAGDKFVAEWNFETLMPERFSVKMDQTVYSLCHIAEKKQLYIGDSLGHLHLVNLDTKQEERNIEAHGKGIFEIVYNKHKAQLYTLGGDGVLRIWQLPDLRLLLSLPIGLGKLRNAALNTNESMLAIADGDGPVRIFETEFYNEVACLPAHDKGSGAVAWHPFKPLLITGGRDAHLRFWKTDENFRLVREIPAHNYAIYAIRFHPNDWCCATASRDKTIKIWDSATFDEPIRIDRKAYQGHLNSVNAIHWLQHPQLLISAGDDRIINAWEITR
jgi:WD40 repeat protein